jgi:hypothetical protein
VPSIRIESLCVIYMGSFLYCWKKWVKHKNIFAVQIFIFIGVYIQEQAHSEKHICVYNLSGLQSMNLPVPMSVIIMCYVLLLWVMIQSMVHMMYVIMVIVHDVIHCIPGNRYCVTSLSKGQITTNLKLTKTTFCNFSIWYNKLQIFNFLPLSGVLTDLYFSYLNMWTSK